MEKQLQRLKIGRNKTDNSLLLERGKTDESFNHENDETHDQTDQTVLRYRNEADEARMKQRAAADSLKTNLSAGDLAIRGNEENLKALAKQRTSEDQAIKNERSNVDTALYLERDEKYLLMNRLVMQERHATDKNLLDERVSIDLETALSTELLTAESTEHLKTKSALLSREEFIAIVSHDLRNPIGTILSFSELLLEDSAINISDGEVKAWIQLIKRNAETSLRLIGDILDMERIVEGKIQLELTENRITDLINNSIESYTLAASTKKILLKTSSPSKALITCDKDRVAQIFSNLIGNALKFTPENGSVTVDVQEAENEITVSICDTGPGIADDQKIRIFERFAQIGNKKRSGIGLGLYISKMLVESHLGKIWVTSELGSGSTFWFTLPKRSPLIHS